MKTRQTSVRGRVVVVASRFNEPVTQRLVDGALETLVHRGIARSRVRILWVPGAFELPVAATWAAHTFHPQAIVALGCLIKGQTPQYAAIGHAVAVGLAQVSVHAQIPIGFGVIVADSFAQAKARSGGGAGHRGREAVVAVLEMVALKRQLRQRA